MAQGSDTMDILYVDYDMYGKEDIISGFRSLGYDVDCTDIPVACNENNDIIKEKLDEVLRANDYTYVFTSNYYPIISDTCRKYNIKYISWTYDSPLVNLYDKSINNSCNYAFVFDKSECQSLWDKGVKTVYYMPLAVNSGRLDDIKINTDDKQKYCSDVSFVGSMYNESHNLYDRMEPKLSEYTRGYLTGVMQIQKNLFGAFVLEDAIRDKKIIGDMYKAMPYELHEGSLAGVEYVYANYFLARKIANIQRMEYISGISKRFRMKVYTTGDISTIETAQKMGPVAYETDMNKVFRLSKINLNITLPSIHTGIPLRAMDILGNGGFLLTNYQEDLLEFFEPGVDFVYYSSVPEAIELIGYYLHHEEERKQIAENAYYKVKKYHQISDRLADMIYIAQNN